MKDKNGRISPGIIKVFIVSLVLLTVLLSMAPSLVNNSATSVKNLTDEFSGNSDIYGTTASTLGGNLTNWTGVFWVIAFLLLLITVILKLFQGR